MGGLFFIIGLPRSRTAWLANLFNTESVMCYHDILATYEDKDIEGVLQTTYDVYGKKYVGVADTYPVKALCLRRMLPEAPIVVVEREPAEVVYSMTRAFPEIMGDARVLGEFRKFIIASLEALEFIKKMKGVTVFQYGDLEQPETVKRIWGLCCPDVRFDDKRANFLQGMKVTVNYSTFGGALSYMAAQKRSFSVTIH